MSRSHPSAPELSRRGFLLSSGALLGSAALAGCSTTRERLPTYVEPAPRTMPADLQFGFGDYASMYAAVEDEGFLVPAVPWQKIDNQFLRQVVDDPTGQPPGTVVVNTTTHHLYLVREQGYAVRYGVGLGRAGFEWAGDGVIQWKQKWPKWTPPAEMIARDPSLAKWGVDYGGMPGGLKNPLGARAHYIFQNGQDTLYRVHGSPEWSSIGRSVSSGCVRMMNQDAIDFYERVRNGARIQVIGPTLPSDGMGEAISLT
ncbi:MAG: hypothetical protein DI629_03665 [Mesorhizobium amorphae]|nr:MAG: hypothetical protein DI629_03665 [Mesorhizobium amorphae]